MRKSMKTYFFITQESNSYCLVMWSALCEFPWPALLGILMTDRPSRQHLSQWQASYENLQWKAADLDWEAPVTENGLSGEQSLGLERIPLETWGNGYAHIVHTLNSTDNTCHLRIPALTWRQVWGKPNYSRVEGGGRGCRGQPICDVAIDAFPTHWKTCSRNIISGGQGSMSFIHYLSSSAVYRKWGEIAERQQV